MIGLYFFFRPLLLFSSFCYVETVATIALPPSPVRTKEGRGEAGQTAILLAKGEREKGKGDSERHGKGK